MSGKGKITFGAAVLMNINIIVGAGYLFGPSKMAAAVGSLSFLGWLAVGLLVFPVIWCVAQAARIFPGEGGFYNYCSKGINPLFGFIAQWVYLVGYMGTALVFTLAIKDTLVNKAGFAFINDYSTLFFIAVIAFFSLLNMLPIEQVSKIQSVATLFKLIPMFAVILLIPFYFKTNVSYACADVSSFVDVIPVGIFAFWGFECCASIGHMLKDGPQAVGRVTLTAFFLVAAAYTLFHFGLIHIMGVEGLIKDGPVLFPKYLGFSPEITSILLPAIVGAIAFSYMNCVFGVMLGNMTNLYLMAKNKLIAGSSVLTKTTNNDRPFAAAGVLAGVLFGMLMFIDSIKVGMGLTNIGVSSAFVLTLVALVLHNVKRRDFMSLFVTLLGCASCAVLIYYSWLDMGAHNAERLMYAIPLAVGLVVGLVLHFFAAKKPVARKSR